MIDRIRTRSLFFGPFQFFTLAIFIYAMLETAGMWFRWVMPQPTLYSGEAEGRIAPSSIKELNEQKLKEFIESRRQSIGDRLLYQAIFAGPRGLPPAEDTGGLSDITSLGPKNDRTVEVVEANNVTNTLESYRRHLLDEAIARQDKLETLGDTMLKLAFMGTVYGISSALFAARALDTADPINKLLAKAEMYSGIGVGFGTTLTGIVLSICAAHFRTALAGGWSEAVGRAYDLILNFGPGRFVSKAASLRLNSKSWPTSPEMMAAGKTGVPIESSTDKFFVIGLTVIILMLTYVAYRLLLIKFR